MTFAPVNGSPGLALRPDTFRPLVEAFANARLKPAVLPFDLPHRSSGREMSRDGHGFSLRPSGCGKYCGTNGRLVGAALTKCETAKGKGTVV